jgi:hypothetical protein
VREVLVRVSHALPRPVRRVLVHEVATRWGSAAGTIVLLAVFVFVIRGLSTQLREQGRLNASTKHNFETALEKMQREEEQWEHDCAIKSAKAANDWLERKRVTDVSLLRNAFKYCA